MGCGMIYNASGCFAPSELPQNAVKPPILWFCGASTEWTRNSCKSCSYARSKPWEFLIYHFTSPRGIPRHSVNRSRERLKAWLIAFNFDRFRAPPGPVIFFSKTFLWCATRLIMHPGWFGLSELPKISPNDSFIFCRAATEWPRNSRKSFSYVRSMPWEFLIYHHISPRGIPRHSVHGSRGRLKAWLIAFNFDRFRPALSPVIVFDENLPMECDTTYNASRVLHTI